MPSNTDAGGKRFRIRCLGQPHSGADSCEDFDTFEEAKDAAEQRWAAGDLYGVVVTERMSVEGRLVWVALWSLPLV
ncbi:hypothetical protein sos41_37110 [Alphaproteobacteria bacterium SO-S41]|nr:hypothetical protein sos41_37110 [Alphaproteobacteria bacterium SO-S41]